MTDQRVPTIDDCIDMVMVGDTWVRRRPYADRRQARLAAHKVVTRRIVASAIPQTLAVGVVALAASVAVGEGSGAMGDAALFVLGALAFDRMSCAAVGRWVARATAVYEEC